MIRLILDRRFELIVFILLLGVCSGETAAQDEVGPHDMDDWNKMLHWFPADLETFIVARGPLQVPTNVDRRPTFQDSLQLLLLRFASRVQDGALAEELKGHDVQIAVEGSRRFTAPSGLGMMRYEGCQILKFEESADDALRRALEKTPEGIKIGEIKVAKFRVDFQSDEWLLLVSRPRPATLVIATDANFLKEVLARMRQGSRDRALSDSLPEWAHVETDAPVWAIRHYQKKFAESDPSSPLRPRGGANVPDSMAVGFTFWFDGRTARARYLSAAKNAEEIVARGWSRPTHKLSPDIRRTESEVVEISLSIANTSKEVEGRMFLFALLGYLGHAVFL